MTYSTWLFWWCRKMVTAPVDDAVTILSWSKNCKYMKENGSGLIVEAVSPTDRKDKTKCSAKIKRYFYIHELGLSKTKMSQ